MISSMTNTHGGSLDSIFIIGMPFPLKCHYNSSILVTSSNMISNYDLINPTTGYTSTDYITQQMGILLIHTKLPNNGYANTN